MTHETRSLMTGLLLSLLVVTVASTSARLWRNATVAHAALLQAEALNATLDIARH